MADASHSEDAARARILVSMPIHLPAPAGGPAPAATTGFLAPRIEVSVCTACGQCVVVCPSAAIGIDVGLDSAWVPSIDDGRCTWCFDCESACPQRAIDIPFEVVEEERTLA